MSQVINDDGFEHRYANGRLAWRCDHCGAVSAWTETWVQFGAIEDDPDLMTFCCREHGEEHERAQPQLFSKKRSARNLR